MVSYFIWPKEDFIKLCIPADYKNAKLRGWNQRTQAVKTNNPWLRSDVPWVGLSGRLLTLRINSGNSAYLRTEQYHPNHMLGYEPQWAGNWSVDKVNHKTSFEFYIDNDLEETSPTEIYDDNEFFWTENGFDTGSMNITISENTVEVQKGTSSLEMVIATTGGSFNQVGVRHDYGGSPQDWSSEDFICLWLYGTNSGNENNLYLRDSAGDWARFDSIDDYTDWKRFVFPLRNPDGVSGTLDLTDIKIIDLLPATGITSGTWILDRMVIDVGQWTKIEVYIPDELSNIDTGFKMWYWDGSQYIEFYSWNPYNIVDTSKNLTMKFLDSSDTDTIYGNFLGKRRYGIGERGEVNVGDGDPDGGTITYSSYYGCRKRIGFGLKMPPDDFQDSSTFGISQCKLKLEVYYDTVEDTSGNSNHGDRYSGSTINAGPVSVDGKFGKALDFDGSDDYIDVPLSPSLNLAGSNFTLEAWIKADNRTPNQFILDWNTRIILGLSWGSYPDKAYVLYYNATEGNISSGSTTSIENGTWYHLVGVYDGVQLRIFVNGIQEGTPGSGTLGAEDAATDWGIGAQRDGIGYHFDGIIDEARIYNRALSLKEIKDNMKGGNKVTRRGLVGEWKMEFGNATYEFEDSTNQYYGLQNIVGSPIRVQDSSGQENHGTLIPNNARLNIVKGIRTSNALDLDGTDYIDITDTGSLNITGDQITFMAWVKLKTGGKVHAVLNNYNSYWFKADTLERFVGYVRIGGQDKNSDYTSPVSLNEWNHIAITYDGNEIIIFSNGLAKPSILTSGSIDPQTFNVLIGYDRLGNFIEGSIDEVRIYNRALTSNEIQLIYNGNRITNGLVGEWLMDHASKEPWLCLFNPTEKFAKFLILTGKPTVLEITADENERINKIKIDIPSGSYLEKEGLKYGDIFQDSDGDGVPDIFELILPYLPSV